MWRVLKVLLSWRLSPAVIENTCLGEVEVITKCKATRNTLMVYKVGQKQLFVGDAHTLEGRGAGSQILGSRKQQLLNLFKCLKYAFPLKVGVGNGVLAKAL